MPADSLNSAAPPSEHSSAEAPDAYSDDPEALFEAALARVFSGPSGFAQPADAAALETEAAAYAFDHHEPPLLFAADLFAEPAAHASSALWSAPPPALPQPAWWALHAEPARVDVKIDDHSQYSWPTALPPGLASATAALFAHAPLALTAAVAPGCTLLTFEAVVPAGPPAAAPGRGGTVGASAALQSLLTAPQGVGAYFSARECVRLAAQGRVATARRGVLVSDEAVACAPRLPQLFMLAAACDVPVRLRVNGVLPPREQLRCRLHGRFLAIRTDAGSLALAAAGEEGVALLEHAGEARAPPRPLLLCADARVVAELNAAVPKDADAAEAAVMLLGHALRPGAPPALLAAAAAACMRQRWHAAAERCIGMLVAQPAGFDESDATNADVAAPRLLLHEAVAAGSAALVRAVLAAGGAAGRFGAAGSAGAWPGGATPLHLAAAHTDAALAALLTCCDADASAGAATGAAATVAWFQARDATGATPSHLACAGSAAMRSLDAALRALVQQAQPLARAAAAAVQVRHGVFHWPHLAELACNALADAAQCAPAGDSAGAAAQQRCAAVAAALLCDAAAAWTRHEKAQAAASLLVPRSSFTDADAVAAEARWRFQLYLPGIEVLCALQSAYHIAQCMQCLKRSAPLPAPEPWGGSADVLLPATIWRELAPRTQLLLPSTLWFQAPATGVLLGALLSARGRALLARHLQPVLAVQYVLQALACTILQACLAQRLHIGPYVLWPMRLAGVMASFTLICAVCWPMRSRWALPLLAARAALPLACAWEPRRFGRFWPVTGAAGAALQTAACVLAAALTLRRERRLPVLYARHVASTAAGGKLKLA